MKKIGKVNVVSVDYTLYLYEDGEFDTLQNDAKERDDRYHAPHSEQTLDGYCDYTQKEIRVYRDKYTDENYFSMTLRHEITHAFLYEIGNSNYGDEDYVDKISKWVVHIMRIYDDGVRQLIVNDTMEKGEKNA